MTSAKWPMLSAFCAIYSFALIMCNLSAKIVNLFGIMAGISFLLEFVSEAYHM